MSAPVAEFAAPAGPYIGVGALGGLALIVLLGTLLALGMQKAWQETFGSLLRHLADVIDIRIPTGVFGGIHPLRPVARFLRAADQQVMNAFGWLALKGEAASAWLFSTAGHLFWWTTHEVAALAEDTYRRFEQVTVQTIPQAVHRAEAATLARLRGIDQTVGRLEAQAKAQLKRLQVGIDRLDARITSTLTHTLAGIRSRVGTLERAERTAQKDIARLKTKTAAKVLAAGVVATLTARGLGCLFGRNGRKAVGSLCRMPSHWLDEALGLLTDFFFLTHICQVIPWLEEGFALVAAPLIETLGNAGAGLCGASYKPAARAKAPVLFVHADPLPLNLPG